MANPKLAADPNWYGASAADIADIQAEVDKIDSATMVASPAAGSLARFVASGGTALGTPLAASKSLVDALGTNGSAVTDSSTSVLGAIGANNADNAFSSSLVAANQDGSVLERLEALLLGMVSALNPHYLAVTADFTNGTWNSVASHEVFDVSGMVRIRMWVAVTGNVDSLAHGAALGFGHALDADAYIVATDEEALDTGELWYDAAPTQREGNFGNVVLDRVVNGIDVGYTVEGEALTTGSMVFYCVWEPLTAGATVVAGAGGPL